MKTCSTCKYKGFNVLMSIFGREDLQYCKRPNRQIDIVSGKPKDLFCSLERKYNAGNSCGVSGKFHSDNEVKK